MTWASVADAVGLVCLLCGALLCLAAAIGLLRLPDVYSRMHAATKPQTLGVLLVLLGMGLRLRSGLDVGMLVLVGVFQMLTIPVSAHLLARSRYRLEGSPGQEDLPGTGGSMRFDRAAGPSAADRAPSRGREPGPPSGGQEPGPPSGR